MAHFQYDPLNFDTQEIRLIKLLPGRFEDSIRIGIAHVPLPVYDSSPPSPDALNTLQHTLPSEWRVVETVEGRVIFSYKRERTSWNHPDPSGDHLPGGAPRNDAYPYPRPKYEALSYSWGLSEPQELITVEIDPVDILQEAQSPHSRVAAWMNYEVGSSTATLPARPNLASALRHLRNNTNPRTLWVDAVCINQSDFQERARHVARMDSVYKLALRVIVWLGPEMENSALALDTLEGFGQQIELAHGSTMPSPACTHPEWITELPGDSFAHSALRTLLGRTWFQRL